MLGIYFELVLWNVTNGMKMWQGKGNATTLLFSVKGLEILHQERRGQVKIMVMEHVNSILFHTSGPANKHHTNQSITVQCDPI